MTEYAVPLWLFLFLFLILPLVVVIAMTFQRHRDRAARRPGFQVLPDDKLRHPDRK